MSGAPLYNLLLGFPHFSRLINDSLNQKNRIRNKPIISVNTIRCSTVLQAKSSKERHISRVIFRFMAHAGNDRILISTIKFPDILRNINHRKWLYSSHAGEINYNFIRTTMLLNFITKIENCLYITCRWVIDYWHITSECLMPLSTRGYGMEAKPQCSSRRRDWHGYVSSSLI